MSIDNWIKLWNINRRSAYVHANKSFAKLKAVMERIDYIIRVTVGVS